MNDPHAPTEDPSHEPSHELFAPRPRLRSRASSSFDKARLFAAALRALLGAVGFFGALLYLPIQMATPVLAGVSLLMVVSGSASAWRAVSDAPALRRLPLALMGLCGVVIVATVILTLVLGAGALGPVHAARAAREQPPTVTFEPPPASPAP